MNIIGRCVRITGIVFICFIAIIPFYVLVFFSLNAPPRVFYEGNIIIPDFYFNNFTEAWVSSNIGRAILNSVIITGGSLLLLIILSSSAGYTIARFKNKFNKTVFTVLLTCMMIPGIINTVPLYTVMRSIGGINTRIGMILVCTTNALPFSVFLYSSFISSLSREIEESAIIDGCTWFKAFWKITFHYVKPVTAAVVILNGVSIWNNYAQAVFFLTKRDMYTIPIALSIYFQQYAGAKWNLMAAAAVLGVIPVVTVFLLFQKYFMKGITAGALKG